MRRPSPILLIVLLFGFIPNAFAVTIETEKFRLGINGYINAKYTYMTKMAMQMGSMIMEMDDDVSTFETDANLIFNAVRDRFRGNLNFELTNAVSINGQPDPMGMNDETTTGKFNLLEVFGQYSFSEPLQVRLGQFLSPFGIYNQIRFVSPLYAPVVLPMMYQPPMNFPGDPLVPADGNAMIFGTAGIQETTVKYYIYIGNGEQASTGRDKNKDKGFGGRIKVSLPANLKVGGSYYYTAEDEPAADGKQNLYGGDLEIEFNNLNLQGEFIYDDLEKVGNRKSYYGRLTYQIQAFSPFIGYDFIEDKGSILFMGGQERLSIGLGYRANPNIFLKAEYHYHRFKNPEGFMGAPDVNHMVRTAAIFIF